MKNLLALACVFALVGCNLGSMTRDRFIELEDVQEKTIAAVNKPKAVDKKNEGTKASGLKAAAGAVHGSERVGEGT